MSVTYRSMMPPSRLLLASSPPADTQKGRASSYRPLSEVAEQKTTEVGRWCAVLEDRVIKQSKKSRTESSFVYKKTHEWIGRKDLGGLHRRRRPYSRRRRDTQATALLACFRSKPLRPPLFCFVSCPKGSLSVAMKVLQISRFSRPPTAPSPPCVEVVKF